MKKQTNQRKVISGINHEAGQKRDKKAATKNAVTTDTKNKHEKGIDWELYENLYASTGFGSKYKKKEDRQQPSVSKDASKGKTRNTGTTRTSKTTQGKDISRNKETRGKQDGGRKSRPTTPRVTVPKTTDSGEIICAHHKKCGGCQLQGTDYAKQLSLKQKRVQELLHKFGKVEPIIGMENPYNYRNKVHAVFDRDRRGNYISGTYIEGTHDVVAIEECMIQSKTANEIINSIRGLLKSFKIKTYDEDTGYGLLRRVLVRTGYQSGEVMVVLVLGSPILPSKNNFVKALRKLHPEITTIVINVNNKQTSMILGDKETTIYGKGYIEDTLCGCRFRISPKSFYQVNPVQTEVLYRTAIELAGLDGTQTVIDAYCGIGTIGMIASKHAKEVIGVELNSDAVKDAIANAKLNNISNISFYNNDAGKFMVKLAEENEKVDVVFMDPPRAGSDETFMDCIAKLAPKKVVYVSCNPETLARDLEYMTKQGYQVKRMIPVDMFAFTSHVETVVLLERKGR